LSRVPVDSASAVPGSFALKPHDEMLDAVRSQTVEMIIVQKLPLEVVVVRHVPQDLYEATNWPTILEAARQVFMAGKWPEAGSKGSVPSRSNGRISA